MRTAVALVAALATSAIAPAAAFALEPAGAVHGPYAGPSQPETELEFLHRPQLVLMGAASDGGIGAGAGLRFRWIEVSATGDTTLDDSRGFVGVKLFATPDSTLSPYIYGHAGQWVHEEFFGPHDEGDYRAAGVGLDVHTSRHSFVFLELGYGEKSGGQLTETSGGVFNGSSPEVHFGVGLRI
jgi:hypothetical protein